MHRPPRVYQEKDKIFLTAAGFSVHGTFGGTSFESRYEVYQKSHCITQEGAGVYVRRNTLYRKRFSLGSGAPSLIRDEKTTENHALMMYESLLERGTEKEP